VPTKCDECGEIIMEFEYYYFEKRSLDKSKRLLVEYYCCPPCYVELLPTEGFKYPVNKLVRKELPERDRGPYYIDPQTKKKVFEVPFKRVALNPDSYVSFCNTKNKK